MLFRLNADLKDIRIDCAVSLLQSMLFVLSSRENLFIVSLLPSIKTPLNLIALIGKTAWCYIASPADSRKAQPPSKTACNDSIRITQREACSWIRFFLFPDRKDSLLFLKRRIRFSLTRLNNNNYNTCPKAENEQMNLK